MSYPPVDFRALRYLLTVASVEDDPNRAARRLRSVLIQLALFEPSVDRDNFRALIELAEVQPGLIKIAEEFLARWAINAATTQTREQMQTGIKRQIAGEKGNAEKKTRSADRQDDWQKQANLIWKQRPDLSKREVASRIAENSYDDLKKDYIRKKIKKPEK